MFSQMNTRFLYFITSFNNSKFLHVDICDWNNKIRNKLKPRTKIYIYVISRLHLRRLVAYSANEIYVSIVTLDV